MKSNGVKIAILSGKGGTGKTLVSVNLAFVAGKSVYIDCDVEEPNGHLFFKPEDVSEEDVTINVPSFNESLCSGCRKCVNFCKFNALAFIKNKPYVFEELCHSCGGCILFCPEKAIGERKRSIGKVQKGVFCDVTVSSGILNPGEVLGTPIVKKLLENNSSYEELPVFIDCPPGSACIVMESIKDADYCILVAEPTVFGVQNLHMVYDLVRLLKKPYGVVLNKCLDGQNPSEKFCMDYDVPILGLIPFDKELGRLNSDAMIIAKENEHYEALFSSLLEIVMKKVVQYETAIDPQR